MRAETVSDVMPAGELSPHWVRGDRGRPPRFESDRRRRHFASLVAGDIAQAGGDAAAAVFRFREHAEEARVEPLRALELLGDPAFRRTVEAIVEGLKGELVEAAAS